MLLNKEMRTMACKGKGGKKSKGGKKENSKET